MLKSNPTTQTNSPQSLAHDGDRNIAKILVVDDEDDIRFALTRILRLEGYRADQAGSGVEALDMLADTDYDLMVLDMRMPEMGGTEVMQRVQQTHPDLLIIVLTGQATLDSAIAAARVENVVDYLLKPVSNDKFVETVILALQKRSERLRQQQLLNAAAQMLTVMQSPDASNIKPDSRTAANTLVEAGSHHLVYTPPLTLDRQKRLVTMTDNPGQIIELTKGETAILAWFMTHPNQTLSCYELVTHALGYETTEEEAESVIRPYIFRLRRKIEPTPKHPRLIDTIRRKGYRFNCPAT